VDSAHGQSLGRQAGAAWTSDERAKPCSGHPSIFLNGRNWRCCLTGSRHLTRCRCLRHQSATTEYCGAATNKSRGSQ
jgi:hypothetical protein